MDKKIAVHVTNEEQWDEIREYYGNEFPYGHGLSYARNIFRNKELAQTSDSFWGTVACYHESNEYELLEFSEWKDRVKGENMEKIEVPQAVYDEFKLIDGDTPFGIANVLNRESCNYPNLLDYLCQGNYTENRVFQLNLAKVMAGVAEFVPIEEKYYWQDKQGWWLGYSDTDTQEEIIMFGLKMNRNKLTETEIREKTSFDIDKLKKVSE